MQILRIVIAVANYEQLNDNSNGIIERSKLFSYLQMIWYKECDLKYINFDTISKNSNSSTSNNNFNGLLWSKIISFVNLCLKNDIFWFITYLKHLSQVAYLCAKRLFIDCEKRDLEGGSQNVRLLCILQCVWIITAQKRKRQQLILHVWEQCRYEIRNR